MTDITPLILCGGSGSRLWPLSRSEQPKQFQTTGGPGSPTFFQSTVQRHRGAGFGDPVVVTNARQSMIVARQLREIQTRARIIGEPVGRNTGPAVLAAALDALTRDPDAKLLVLPSDHMITGDLSAAVLRMRAAADLGRIVTFGVTPAYPETGYGYIVDGGGFADYPGLHRVDRFVEKPPFDLASALIAEGNAFWSSGISLFRADTLVQEFRLHAPDTLAAVSAALHGATEEATHLLPEATAFAAAANEPTERLVFERTDRIALAPLHGILWDDVGAWNAVHKISARCAQGNVTSGDVLALDTRNSLIRGDSRLVAVVGLSDVIVVDTPDAVLVTNRDNAQNVKKVVEALKSRARPEVETHTARDTRWGRIETLSRNRGFSLDLLTVEPGATAMINGTGIAPSLVTFLSPGGFYERDGHRIEARPGECIEVEADIVLPVTNGTRGELRMVKLTLASEPQATRAETPAALPATPNPATA